MEIETHLSEDISQGGVVLYIGAGAVLDATNADGEHPPSGKLLGELMSKKFLGGKYNDNSLAEISDYAVSEHSLFAVQQYIKDIFDPFEPSAVHLRLPRLPWRGIVTTNYDRIIEKAYEKCGDARLQHLVPFVENGDQVDDRLRGSGALPLIKLHGCVTRIANSACPLIITTEQFDRYLPGRSRLYSMLQEWAWERTIVFVGSSLRDPDLRFLLHRMTDVGEERPRYYAVSPDWDQIQNNYWQARRVTLLSGTLSEFIDAIGDLKETAALIDTTGNVANVTKQETDVRGLQLSERAVLFLNVDCYVVSRALKAPHVKPTDFYKGYSPEWVAVDQGLDVKRSVTKRMLRDIDESEQRGEPVFEFLLLKGPAGCGKSIILQRLAWEMAAEYGSFCLYLKKSGRIDFEALREVATVSADRVYIFIDNIVDHVKEIDRLIDALGDEIANVTLIGCERMNEFNTYCEEISDLVTEAYEVHRLSEEEILELLALLEQASALGVLQQKSPQERVRAFTDYAGRHLLVALYELTLGRNFEEIIVDEFRNIRPGAARNIYLSICVLNRLDVPVRAGIVSRLHGIRFTDFKDKFFAPLEQVVQTGYDEKMQEYFYTARHPKIAEIVFANVLDDPEHRLRTFLRCMQHLNIDYAADRKAFKGMVHAKTLMANFSDHEMISLIYSTARKMVNDDPLLLHQAAIYEMKRANGNLNTATELLEEALSKAPHLSHVRHSLIELHLKRADSESNIAMRDSLYEEATERARELVSSESRSAPACHTLLKALLNRIALNVDDQDSDTTLVEELVIEAEQTLQLARQQFPENTRILQADADFAKIVSDSARALESMKRAFAANPRNSLIATRLARQLTDIGDESGAECVLRRAVDINGNEGRTRFALANLLLKNNGDPKEIEDHLRHSFSLFDKNFMAKILYGRQLYFNDKVEEGQEFFRKVRGQRAPWELRERVQTLITDRSTGELTFKATRYGFLCRDGFRDNVFVSASDLPDEDWLRLKVGDRVEFELGFTLLGARAVSVSKV